MPFGGLWKVLFWTAPVIAFFFWYISDKQSQHEEKQDVQKLELKRDFAQMNAEFDGKGDPDYWNKRSKELEQQLEQKKTRAKVAEARVDKMMGSAHEAEDGISDDDLEKLKRMSSE